MLVMGFLALLIRAGFIVAGPALGAEGDTNHADTWETLPGEVCTRINTVFQTGGVTVPAPPEGRTWSKLIIKKGSGEKGVENQVFTNPQPGHT